MKPPEMKNLKDEIKRVIRFHSLYSETEILDGIADPFIEQIEGIIRTRLKAEFLKAVPEERNFTSTDPVFTDSPDGCAGFNLCRAEILKRLEELC